MDHADHVQLLAAGVPRRAGVWADFGAGGGAFTLALRELAGADAEIYAVDADRRALDSLKKAMERRFPGSAPLLVRADFTQPIELPVLDGIVAANSLHFVPFGRQVEVLRLWRDYLAPAGRLILVEYDADDGNRWVPYPILFARLSGLAGEAG
ncbi:MAG: class I SAM-dependent methyltransferase, partial [Dehalococcoidia bacterium]